ncbi:MAG: DUF1295 domain-containing protein [Ilumatobacteraceae bacterium]|nr:DUF1295 domain-containing protein [Ilumatobacteraceae bacterium]
MMLATWGLSVLLKNASIVDVVWGLGFVVVAWVMQITIDGDSPRQLLLTAMVTIWGLRLAGYLYWRNHGKGEDWRYVAMRKKRGAQFPIYSLVTVFGLQGTLMWIVSLPVQLGNADATPSIGPIAVIGIILWFVGISFEVVGDRQLARFRADPDSSSKVLDTGLWSLTRHPNYFGDSLAWWGIAVVAAETGSGAIGLIGPIAMTFFLMKVSGVPMLERSMSKRKPGYAQYMQRTSSFFPLPPKKK